MTLISRHIFGSQNERIMLAGCSTRSSLLIEYRYLLSLVIFISYTCKILTGQHHDGVISPRLIQLHINAPQSDGPFEVDSSFRLQCRFKRNQQAAKPNLRFNLRWLRSLAGNEVENQTITETDIDSSSSSSTIIAATTRIWSVRKEDGLDLEVNSFQANDSGTYYCQALSVEPNPALLAETSVKIAAAFRARGERTSTELPAGDEANSSFDSYQLYSQENLSKLLPSLKITPSSFNQISVGETIQLVCITNDLDPDPEPDQLEWTFEPISDRLSLLERSPPVARQLPHNVTVLGNALIIWSMQEDHSGLYKCTYRMGDFNLTAQASAEVHAISGEQVYSAPLVFVRPELVRLSVNGSATIQCETTGYPPPELIWYRVSDLAKSELIVNSSELSARHMDQARILESHIEGLVVERAGYKDLAAHCRLNRCLIQAHEVNPAAGSQHGRLQLTGLSMIHLHDAKASHQGQYVCQASNKHGSNQASCIVDVEIKEAPSVSIAARDRQQSIVLPSESSSAGNSEPIEQQNVTFRCSVTAGRPRPRLRWLRTGTGSAKTNLQVDNLDLYDLTRVSSATSNVKTIAEDNGNTLTLIISTISLDDEGDYVCLAENEVGRQSAVARLIVRKPASIRILQSSPHVAKLNDSFHLDCLVAGHPIPVDIEWSRTDRGSFFSLISRAHSNSQERALLKFDRVTQEELGEYTCNARDPLNATNILRDTIMVVLGDTGSVGQVGGAGVMMRHNENVSLLPKLMVRPTKVNALAGSNVTLDCLAVSGLQPTLVEWLAPTNQPPQYHSETTSIRAYYRTGDISQSSGQPLQFGSKLRILNLSKAHEGIYQCRGKNRAGIEVAAALIKVVDPRQSEWDPVAPAGSKVSHLDGPPYSIGSPANAGHSNQPTRTKVAKFGSNIELKCQVNGVEQPATSWSRDGLELPKSSVQIGHNLWIQNVTTKDNGLYVCSARSLEPNRIIQAKINLLVEETQLEAATKRFMNLEAKIVASKSQVYKGDSITLECIISSGSTSESAPEITKNKTLSQEELDEAERNVIWTNLHSGQSLFQDNVYILGNLLIIYELKFENSATYRCNYNDLSQYTDFKLQVLADPSSMETNSSSADFSSIGTATDQASFNGGGQHRSNEILFSRGQRAELKQIPFGSRLELNCSAHLGDHYHWSRGSSRLSQATDNRPLVIDWARTRDAGIYSCHHRTVTSAAAARQVANSHRYLVNVLVPAARFTQAPVSFITLPTISGANQQQLEIELKFLPENGHGLLLFHGQQQQLSAMNKTPGFQSSTTGDYLALGMVDGGHLEFKFELGDGTTSLRSLQPLSLNRWHRVMIERNRGGAVMWIDDQPAVSNSSAGKFFNLNLDSVLFVGGHQHFLYQRSVVGQQQLYGYTQGFHGCISLLRISRQEINLMARNRSVAVGIFECHQSECAENYCSTSSAVANESLVSSTRANQSQLRREVNGVCQVDRDDFDQSWEPTRGQLSAKAGLRCICMPGLGGEKCDEPSSQTTNLMIASTNSSLPVVVAPQANTQQQQNQAGRACELLNPCFNLGTVQCQSLTSQSYYCHCKVGFMGTDCSKAVVYDDEHSIQFNQHSYVQLAFNKAGSVESNLRNDRSAFLDAPSPNGSSSLQLPNTKEFSATNYARQTSMADHQNISFKLQTNSSYGLLFYTGQINFNSSASVPSAVKSGGRSGTSPQVQQQTSKSMIVNLMWRLSRGSVSDYLAVGLVDGHVEVSYELGSGAATTRSARRVNDDQMHSIQLSRSGKLARLTIDQVNKHEVSSPGRLSVLNNEQEDFYIGGLPLSVGFPSVTSTNTAHGQAAVIYSTHFANFVGCISQFEINSLGPLNLVRSDHLSEVRAAQNLATCSAANGHQKLSATGKAPSKSPHKAYTSPPVDNDDKEPDELK